MTFEEALEAIKQGKIVRCKDSNGYDYEIYEEPEMTVGHAIEVLESVRKSYRYIPDIDGVINFAIEAIEKQNLIEEDEGLNSDNESANIKHAHKKYDNVIRLLHVLLDFYKDNDFYRPKIKGAIECLKRDTEPEHKWNACDCNCSHTGTDTNLQEEMEQVLSRKFFELADTTTDSLAVSNMIEIYRLLFEVK